MHAGFRSQRSSIGAIGQGLLVGIFLLCSVSNSDATIVTGTFTGQVFAGVDGAGTFGPIGSSLVGDSVQGTYQFNTEQFDSVVLDSSPPYSATASFSRAGALKITETINGTTFTQTSAFHDASQVDIIPTQTTNFQTQYEIDSGSGLSTFVSLNMTNFSPTLLTPTGFAQNFSVPDMSSLPSGQFAGGKTAFGQSVTGAGTNFLFSIDQISATSFGPTPLQLAQLSCDVYSKCSLNSPLGVGTLDGNTSFTYVKDNFSGSTPDTYTGLRAAEYANPDGSQIVIAFRGTDGLDISNLDNCIDNPACLKNIAADTSFLTGAVSANLRTSIINAVNFVAQVRGANPNATITLTGHSLGGAIAQMLGKAAGLDATVFDAPGSAQLYSQLGVELVPICNCSIFQPPSIFHSSINYRTYGDIVSQVGSQLDTSSVVTLPGGLIAFDSSSVPLGCGGQTAQSLSSDLCLLLRNEAFFSQEHAIETLIDDLKNSDVPVTDLSDEPNLATTLQNVVQPSLIKSVSINGDVRTLEIHFLFSVLDTKGIAVDPIGGTSFLMQEDPGSPLFTSVLLPTEPGLGWYEFSYESDGIWADPFLLDPGVSFNFADTASAFAFEPFSTAGDPYEMPTDFLFGLNFAGTGEFSGTLTETLVTTTPEPSTWTLLLAGVLVTLGSRKRLGRFVARRSHFNGQAIFNRRSLFSLLQTDRSYASIIDKPIPSDVSSAAAKAVSRYRASTA